MRKTLIYIVILAVLGAGIYYLLPGNKQVNPYDPNEAGFTVKDTNNIGKIFIATQDGESVLVERTDSGWIVNKKYPALRSTLQMVLSTLTQQSALYPVTKAAHDNALMAMSTHGIKVELYDLTGKKFKVFYVGGSAVNNSGTNMLMEGASTPYVVEAAGFVGYLTPRYTTRLRDWRDRTVFNVPAEDIQSVKVEYVEKPENSYTVERGANDSVIVVPAKKEIAASPTGLNKGRADMYMHFFSNINCEGYLNGLEDNDTTFKTAPKYTSVELTTKAGKVQHVDIYWMAVNKRSKNQKSSEMDETPQDYDSDRLYAVMNNYKDTILIQQMVFHNILRKAKEFYMPDIKPPVVVNGSGEFKKVSGKGH